MTDIEQPMIHIRLHREGVDMWNQPIKKYKKEEYKKRKRKGKREDTCTIADEQPSTLGLPDFKKVLGYRSP
jgi:hypothetical protein